MEKNRRAHVSVKMYVSKVGMYCNVEAECTEDKFLGWRKHVKRECDLILVALAL